VFLVCSFLVKKRGILPRFRSQETADASSRDGRSGGRVWGTGCVFSLQFSYKKRGKVLPRF